MFRPTRRPSSGLQSSNRLNIVCVWRMLRSHHLACKLYMRHKLRVSRYGGGRALVCRILGGGVAPLGFCRSWRWGEPSGWRLAGLNASHVWRWRSVEQTSCLLVLVFVTLVLDTLCSTGTFVYCIRRSLYNRRPVCYSRCGAGFCM